MATASNKLSALKTASGPGGKIKAGGSSAGRGSAGGGSMASSAGTVFKSGSKSLQMAHAALKTAGKGRGR